MSIPICRKRDAVSDAYSLIWDFLMLSGGISGGLLFFSLRPKRYVNNLLLNFSSYKTLSSEYVRRFRTKPRITLESPSSKSRIMSVAKFFATRKFFNSFQTDFFFMPQRWVTFDIVLKAWNLFTVSLYFNLFRSKISFSSQAVSESTFVLKQNLRHELAVKNSTDFLIR